MRKYPPNPTRHGQPHGLTLVELMVAMAISLVLIVVIGSLFRLVSDMIQVGVATSDVIASSRAAMEQMRRDTQAMAGPQDRAFMVVLQQAYNTPKLQANLEDPPALDTTNGQLITDPFYRPVRSDQLMFFAQRGDMQPIVPAQANTFAGPTVNGRWVRLWYGHCLKTNPNYGDNILRNSSGPLMDNQAIPQPVEDTLDYRTLIDSTATTYNAQSLDRSYNKLASQWILGRQVMFMDSTIAGNTYTDLLADTRTTAAIPGPQAAAVGQVIGDSHLPTALAGYSNALHPENHMALADVTNQDLNTLTGVAGRFNPAVALTVAEYQAEAYRYTYAVNRLWVNPKPALTPQGPAAFPGPLQAWQIAQMHPLFLSNVSDFAVDLALDTDGVGGVDRVTAAEAAAMNPAAPPPNFYHWDGNEVPYPEVREGEIKWYSYYYNEPPMTTNPPTDINLQGREGLWGRARTGYGIGPWNPTVPGQLPRAQFDATKPVTWRVPRVADGDPITFEPYVPKVATDPYLIIGTNNYYNAAAAFVFRHDRPAEWPYAIRIRFRLNDPKGKIADPFDLIPGKTLRAPFVFTGAGAFKTSANVIPPDLPAPPDNLGYTEDTRYAKDHRPGRWFEVILPVKRN